MFGAIFTETLRRSWMQALYWGGGFGLMSFFMVVIVPDAQGLQAMVNLLESLPPILLRATGVGEDISFVATPQGFITVGFFGKALLLFAAYPVIMGLRVTVNEENDGTLDMLLSLPVKRWQVILEKFLAYVVTLVIVVLLFFVGLVAGEAVVGMGLDMGAFLRATLNIVPAMTFILAFTVLIGSLIYNRRLALGIAAGFVFVSFMVDTIGATAAGTVLENLRVASFFSYYDSTGVVQNGVVWGDVLILTVISLAMVAAALWSFQRRDIAV